MYAVHPIALSEVKAIRKHTSTFACQHIVIILQNGSTLPPFYFSNGGVKALFAALKQVSLVRVDLDPLFLLIPSRWYLLSGARSSFPLRQRLCVRRRYVWLKALPAVREESDCKTPGSQPPPRSPSIYMSRKPCWGSCLAASACAS